MRVVHIAWLYGLNNTGGACMAATRLHLALLDAGVESHYICVQQREMGPNVHALPARGLLRIIQYVVTRIVWLLGYLTPKRGIIMPNLVPMFTLGRVLEQIKPDVVHVHWYSMDTISFRQLAEMPCPVVMTLHDLFDVTIEEPFPVTDKRHVDGVSKENANWYERWLFARKRRAMDICRPLMIGPSKWICNIAASTLIGKSLQYHVVSNVFDDAFAYDESLCKRHDKFTILFGANGGRALPRKGWPEFLKALPFLSGEAKGNSEIVVFGESAESYEEGGVPVRFAGALSSSDQLRVAYHKADLLVLPSLMDNAPNVKFEGWFCGLPVVTFNRTGCAEFVEQKVNGWVAPDGDYRSFAEGIEFFHRLYRDADYGMLRARIARDAFLKFNKSAIALQFVESYSQAVRGFSETSATRARECLNT